MTVSDQNASKESAVEKPLSIYRAAKILNRSQWHLGEVVKGNRKSPKLLKRYEALLESYESGIGKN